MNDYRIEHFEVLDSTNKYVIERARNDHEAEGLVVVAGSQTAGKGSKGRSFYSPSGSGCYMSLLLRPSLPLTSASLITPIAAVAVCRAVEGLTGLSPGIKWVNDVVLPEKARSSETSSSSEGDSICNSAHPLPAYPGKVCGILTEAAATPEGGLEWLVLGIGVNLAPPEEGFPKDIPSAASLFDSLHEAVSPDLMANRILDEFRPLYESLEENPESREFLEEYRRRNVVIGKSISVHLPGGTSRPARAIDIDEACRLIVLYSDGRTEALGSGEVSIRPE